jgi:hypothetical protein
MARFAQDQPFLVWCLQPFSRIPSRLQTKTPLQINLYSLDVSIRTNNRSTFGVGKVRKILTELHDIDTVEIVEKL